MVSSYGKIKHENTKEEQLVQKEQPIRKEQFFRQHSCREPVYIPEDSLRYIPKDLEFTLEEFLLYKHIYEMYFLGQPPTALKEYKTGIFSEETLNIIHLYTKGGKEQKDGTQYKSYDYMKYLEDLLPTLSRETLNVMHAFLKGYKNRLYDCGRDFGAYSESRSYNYLLNWMNDLAGNRIYEKIYTGKYVKYIHGGGGHAVLEFKTDTGELLELIIRAGKTLTVGDDNPGVGDRAKVYLLDSDEADYLVGKEEKLVARQPAALAEKDGR